MKKLFVFWTVFFLAIMMFLIWANLSYAQEVGENIAQADSYLDSRTHDLDKYVARAGRIQQRLLRKLRRREARIEKALAAKDSTLYRRYKEQGISYDSIATLSQDTNKQKEWATKKNGLTDSLKNISRFIGDQTGKLNSASGLVEKAGVNNPYAGELAKLQGQLGAQQSIDQLIQQRTSTLEGLAHSQNIPGLQSIQKNVYYAKEQMKAWKKLADDPDAAEEKAMEYLQGTEGFEKYTSSGTGAFGGLGSTASAEDLQRAGFQTKGQMNALLQQKLGDNLGKVQQQMSQQIQQYSDKLNDVTNKVQEAKNSASEARQSLSDVKQTGKELKHIEKPAFKKNPERGKPFWQRLEVQYNFQTSRATPDGLRPAMLDLGASVAFKHTPRLSYGIGIGLSTGLGQNWQNIRFTYEGITARAFTDWQWQYGFSLQAGYERNFRPGNRPYLPEQQNNPGTGPQQPQDNNALKEAFGGQQQAAYLGIMKRYKLGGKWSGTFLLAYNFLWQAEAMRSPIILRFGYGH